ncbi:hypothetical protein ACED96_15465 [Clostridium thermobutyricum]
MKNYNMTLKEALNFIESIEYLKETNEEEFGIIRSEIVDLLELQILKNEFIENISKCNNLKFLNGLNKMIKIAIEKECN